MKVKKQQRKLKPVMKWQKGDFERHAKFKFTLPYQFLLICKLMNVTPNRALSDFMDNISCGRWRREGRDKVKEKLIEYFIEHGYGQENYNIEDIQQIFKEADAIGMLFPNNSKMKYIDQYTQWRDSYYSHWFKKWYKKPGRKKDRSPY